MPEIERVIYLDCPTTGNPHNVTTEYRSPSRAGGSWIRHERAAQLFGMDWRTYTLRVAPWAYDKLQPQDNVQAITCPGCSQVARVWINGRPFSPTGDQHKRRVIDTVTGPRAHRGRCTGACLNGKRSCDCQCNGACHGAGACHCK